ncbi:MAG TPA: SCP2 sterol-binding domain-containing protein [Thermoplasmata archaeon]|nr:SCP2 sterol-binding domain-containing protein [Thermoplasmata archaeon]
MRFPSPEWAAAFQSALNSSTGYREAAQAWEGDLLLRVIEPGDAPGISSGVLLDLWHGECRAASFVPDASKVESEFVYEGGRGNWARLLKGELDPVKAILDGTFKVRGNLAKAMRYTRAAKELVEVAAGIPAEA